MHFMYIHASVFNKLCIVSFNKLSIDVFYLFKHQGGIGYEKHCKAYIIINVHRGML